MKGLQGPGYIGIAVALEWLYGHVAGKLRSQSTSLA
ncbi:hypothetical protein M7I_6283 [Glarea lozoyensis 74030]|uniref:Uncharacterized protein n=1 Tax=Glarea lozoyensis (strain ATCC 74030 / MF5533) TaxID=1104152 RepID=H0EU54_GLAL7|nr:hypothetical protein M7I_6283 [Glarea lozoyensis 74030]